MAFTDGVTEAMNTEMEEYTLNRMKALLEDLHRSGHSAETMLQELVSDVDAHRGRAEQSDDITLGLIEVKAV